MVSMYTTTDGDINLIQVHRRRRRRRSIVYPKRREKYH